MRQTDLEVDLEVELDEGAPRFAPEVESTVYRLVQEALTNIAKHAHAAPRRGARRPTATARSRCVVRDDGTGFDPQQQSSGFGLIGMRERLALVNGTLDVESSRGDRHRAPRVDPSAPERRDDVAFTLVPPLHLTEGADVTVVYLATVEHAVVERLEDNGRVAIVVTEHDEVLRFVLMASADYLTEDRSARLRA